MININDISAAGHVLVSYFAVLLASLTQLYLLCMTVRGYHRSEKAERERWKRLRNANRLYLRFAAKRMHEKIEDKLQTKYGLSPNRSDSHNSCDSHGSDHQ